MSRKPHRQNRPDQKTFFCQVCGYRAHADINAATNLSHRVGDEPLRACQSRDAMKSLLLKRHEQWKERNGQKVARPVQRRKRSSASQSELFPPLANGSLVADPPAQSVVS